MVSLSNKLKHTRMKAIFVICFLGILPVLIAQPAQKFIRSGNTAYQKGHFKDAEIDYRKAQTKAPASDKAKYNLGNALYKQNNFAEASEQYNNLTKLNKSSASKADIYYNLGNALLQDKKYQESIEAYKTALRQNPKDEDTRYNLAYAMSKLQQQKKNNQNKEQQQKQQQQQQVKQEPKTNMNKKDADQMLNAMNNNEKRTLEKKNKPQAVKQSSHEKDW